MLNITLEDITKAGLTEKIIYTIVKIGKPNEIKYGTHRGQITVWETATLTYENLCCHKDNIPCGEIKFNKQEYYNGLFGNKENEPKR